MKIMIADDHKLLLDGLILILNELQDVELLASASNGKELLRLMQNQRPDIVLLDLNMPVMDGFETLKEIKKRYPEIKVIVLSMHFEKYTVSRVMQDNADGYLVKNSDKAEFSAAIRRVAEGGKYFSAELMSLMLQPQGSSTERKAALLSMREVEVIKLLAEGLSSVEIGEKLSLSHRTVDTHRNNIIQKLELRNTAELISFAFKNKLLD